ncbi:c-type cytochrome [Bordetella tumulicola]
MSGPALPDVLASQRFAQPPTIPGGVLHGAVLRPPCMLWDGRRYGGARLQTVDMARAQALPGVVQVVTQVHFVGVVAVSAILARQALDGLGACWQSPPSSAQYAAAAEDASAVETALDGAASDDTAPTEAAPYVWHVAEHSVTEGLGVTVWCTSSHATVWAPCPASYRSVLQEDLGRLLSLPGHRITLVDIDPGRSLDLHILDVLDAVADAVLLSRAAAQPVHVAIQRDPVPGDIVLSPDAPVAYEIEGDATAPPRLLSSQPWGLRPSRARLLSQPTQADPVAAPRVQGINPIRQVAADAASPLTQACIAEFEAMHVFAQESLLDEQAARLGIDPLAHRLAQLPAGPGRALTERMVEQASWQALPPQEQAQRAVARRDHGAETGLRGRGYAAAHVRDEHADGSTTDTWSAWVVEVEVMPATGTVDVTRLVVGHDSQSLQQARQAAIHDQHPQLLDAARRLLAAPSQFDDWGATAAQRTSSSGSQAASHDLMPVQGADQNTGLTRRVEQGQLALDGVVTLPAAAAIANAIFDATGVRLRQVPFNTEHLRDALAAPGAPSSPARRWWRRGGLWLAAGASTVAGLMTMAWPVKPAIAPTTGPDVSLYSAAAIERGRLVAAAGDCVVCHTAPGGKENAGGLGLDTPFGTIYTTNITPDNETGIGQWSYRAFERAMREGVHRDGRQLYPAFPYTAFAKITDADMQALYAYMMVQPPVRSEPPKTALAFPYNVRPAMAGWNLLFHDNRVYEPDPTQTLAWNRGAYLVQGVGHCAACHSPRNALGAEKTGVQNYLAGGEAEGWAAPALDQLATGKVPWTSDELFQYLRTGYSANHGVAAGPMAPVIHGLAELPESDVRAIGTYLLNLPGSPVARTSSGEGNAPAPAINALTSDLTPARTPESTPKLTSESTPASALSLAALTPAVSSTQRLFEGHAQGERIYQNACAVCHEAAAGPTLFGVKPLLATNTNLHAATPDNLVQVILHGIQTPANDDLGYMPGFKDSLDDQQVQNLVGYLRARFAPQESEWADSMAVIGRIRSQSQ